MTDGAPWWRARMHRIEQERSAAVREADTRFERCARAASAAGRGERLSGIGRTTQAVDIEVLEGADSYLIPANLDTRRSSAQGEIFEPPRTGWLQ